MYEFRASQVVQDFVHQPYENTHKHQNCVVDSQAHETNSYKLWTVPWLMATQGEVLDTVKSIQVAFWSFANHLCGLQSSASYPLKSRPLGVWVKPNVYDGGNKVQQSFGVRFLTYLIQESLSKASCLSSLWLYTHLSDLVWQSGSALVHKATWHCI